MRRKGVSFSTIVVIIIIISVVFFAAVKLFRMTGDNKKYIEYVASFSAAIDSYSEKYLSEGFDDYLAKPIEKQELTRVLNKFLK